MQSLSVDIDIIGFVKAHASRMAYSSRFYNWSLSAKTENTLSVHPSDCWGGDSGKGKWLTQGKIASQGDFWKPGLDFWHSDDATAQWVDVVHGFDWLRDLKALGGDPARQAARAYITDWIKHFGAWDKEIWNPYRTGVRIANWISFYDFFGASGDDKFQDIFFNSLNRQTRHLNRVLPDINTHGIEALHAVKGLIFSGITCPNLTHKLEVNVDLLDLEIKRQILSDGGHISRSPSQLLEATKILLDIKSLFSQTDYACPDSVQHAIDRAIPTLKFFRHGDNRLALFNGGQIEKLDTLNLVFKRANNRAKICKQLPDIGFARISQGKTLLIMDTGTPPPSPIDKTAHVAPLSIELSHGKDRIFTNCGTHPLDPQWQDMLRSTAAHNTLVLDDRNACEIKESGHLGRRTGLKEVSYENMQGSILLQAAHDGYRALNGFLHKRRVFITEDGLDIRGEEIIIRDIDTGVVCKGATVRFHLHPRVNVSILKGGVEALLKLPSGMGWRFSVKGCRMELEDSLYMAEGITPRKTKQLVLNTAIFHDQNFIKWALQAE